MKTIRTCHPQRDWPSARSNRNNASMAAWLADVTPQIAGPYQKRLYRCHDHGTTDLLVSFLATLFGAIIWGGLFAILGAITQQPFKGVVAGSAVGAVIGFGFAKGRIGPVIPCMSAFAFVGAFLGPGVDADALSSALFGAAIGAFLGATKLRGLLALIGGPHWRKCRGGWWRCDCIFWLGGWGRIRLVVRAFVVEETLR